VKRQSRVEIAMALNMDVRTVERHYRRAMLILACMIGRQK
jgi:DNA-binding CsgD family transcriptional regulator